MFLREKLLDYVKVVVVPMLADGKDASTQVDGRFLVSDEELSHNWVFRDSWAVASWRTLT